MDMKDRIKQIRLEHKMNQEQFGKEVDLTKGTVSKFENGKAFPSRETIEKIAKRFSVPVNYLYGENNEANQDDNKYEKFKEIMAWLEPLPKDKEDMALDQMLAIAQALNKHHKKMEK
ncbi:XRE family transcriptional regulator [Bacillus anthracis]|uniref:XRE family transcriptional regulator n=1 Tax=Bacillus thuringiensis TaxID=1428 RepID=A0AB36V1A3_BACTU|nr:MULTISPECIES: helix-turn-helix transcriptional regulator [Bacillus cereus group]PEZ62451.1 XRE family transcriptional regulator [Bacillus anthracis]KAA6469332.1 XRE family transcriptional regulator [Bacillus cereus]KAA6479005.1 XRE family transcriptional regulator [Bacillus cereus]KAB2417987.1 helix-turn-helix transcriptional regulator [Bacillus cereus]KAB2434557.1 helix-turn-helix transcriptional regulator [Bacillus cereus]